MTVQEYIQMLELLDQQAQIFVIYDSFQVFAPIPDRRADASDAKSGAKDGIKEGDYLIIAG